MARRHSKSLWRFAPYSWFMLHSLRLCIYHKLTNFFDYLFYFNVMLFNPLAVSGNHCFVPACLEKASIFHLVWCLWIEAEGGEHSWCLNSSVYYCFTRMFFAADKQGRGDKFDEFASAYKILSLMFFEILCVFRYWNRKEGWDGSIQFWMTFQEDICT